MVEKLHRRMIIVKMIYDLYPKYKKYAPFYDLDHLIRYLLAHRPDRLTILSFVLAIASTLSNFRVCRGWSASVSERIAPFTWPHFKQDLIRKKIDFSHPLLGVKPVFLVKFFKDGNQNKRI